MVRHICLLCLGTKTKKAWVLGPEPRRTRPDTLYREGNYPSAFPCTRVVAVVARRHDSRFATHLGWGCVSLPYQLLHLSLV